MNEGQRLLVQAIQMVGEEAPLSLIEQTLDALTGFDDFRDAATEALEWIEAHRPAINAEYRKRKAAAWLGPPPEERR